MIAFASFGVLESLRQEGGVGQEWQAHREEGRRKEGAYLHVLSVYWNLYNTPVSLLFLPHSPPRVHSRIPLSLLPPMFPAPSLLSQVEVKKAAPKPVKKVEVKAKTCSKVTRCAL